MILYLLLLFTFCSIIDASHFSGGTITWKPINPTTGSNTVSIIITQSYSWNALLMNCSINVPISTTGRSTQNKNLTCVDNCATDGNYSINPINILTDCQTVSSITDVMTSQRSVNQNLNAGAYFSIAYTSGYWIGLNNPPDTTLDWSMVCSIDIRLRPDGIINTAPTASVISPQYALVNQQTIITIPVEDANTGDIVKCRWAIDATSNTPPGANECAGICYPTGLPTGTTLSNCAITLLASTAGIWYGIAIQVEDFIDATSPTAMSSVPVQFLIYVLPQPTCGLTPVMLPLNTCFDVQVDVTSSFNMSAMTQCNPSVSNVNSILVATGISGMSEGSLINSLTNQSISFVTFTWTPSSSQLGSQQLCVLAYTSESLQSPQYCVTFNVISSSPVCFTSTTSTTSTTTTTYTKSTTTSATTTTVTTGTTATTTSVTQTTTTTTTSTSSTTTTTTTTTSRTTSTSTSSTSTSATTTTTTSATTTTTTSATTTTTTSATTTTTSSTTSTTTSSATTTTITTTSTTSTSTTTSTTTQTSSTTSTTTSVTTATTTTTSESLPTGSVTMIVTIYESNIEKQRAMWLAMFLPILFLSLNGACFTLYFWYRTPDTN